MRVCIANLKLIADSNLSLIDLSSATAPLTSMCARVFAPFGFLGGAIPAAVDVHKCRHRHRFWRPDFLGVSLALFQASRHQFAPDKYTFFSRSYSIGFLKYGPFSVVQ